jgi:hypothetical protein
MNSSKHTAQPAGPAPAVGRIAPLNMTSGADRLSYDSLMKDVGSANSYSGNADCLHCHLWACAAVRG